jgi:DNA-binding transcriptional LysR family regulator
MKLYSSNRPMDRAGEMTAFVRAVETGGFSAAARDLGLTPSALSKLVTRLEDRLGARLLQRTTRRLQLTAEGEAFYASGAAHSGRDGRGRGRGGEAGVSPRGLLRLHCGSAFGMHQLAPAIPRFSGAFTRRSELDITISDEPLARWRRASIWRSASGRSTSRRWWRGASATWSG